LILSAVISETRGLSEASMASYKEQGYVSVEDMIPPEEVRQIRDTLLGLFARRAGYEEGAQYDFFGRDDANAPQNFPSLHDPTHYAPELAKTEFHKRALAIARQLLGKDAALYGEHALLKPARIGPHTPWHQDEAFRSPDFQYKELSIWLALQPVDMVNGCMQFIPGSHKHEVMEHRSPGGDKSLHPLECCGPFQPADAVPVPLPAGGCTIHDMRTLHYTAPNTSEAPRLAYILIFNTPPVYKPGQRSFPWLAGRHTDSQTRKKQWHRRGGLVVEVMRRLPRARVTNPRWLAWATIRAMSKAFKGVKGA
jgi:ectoine hydroxylase-related dioxygenase (phytanoyl-CoA dioxygenase family)